LTVANKYLPLGEPNGDMDHDVALWLRYQATQPLGREGAEEFVMLLPDPDGFIAELLIRKTSANQGSL